MIPTTSPSSISSDDLGTVFDAGSFCCIEWGLLPLTCLFCGLSISTTTLSALSSALANKGAVSCAAPAASWFGSVLSGSCAVLGFTTAAI
uniref:Uncharacterized protein n=1 Tax=Arundo donax TaxID=35708 RepID=A0A0A9F4D2_ARUDO